MRRAPLLLALQLVALGTVDMIAAAVTSGGAGECLPAPPRDAAIQHGAEERQTRPFSIHKSSSAASGKRRWRAHPASTGSPASWPAPPSKRMPRVITCPIHDTDAVAEHRDAMLRSPKTNLQIVWMMSKHAVKWVEGRWTWWWSLPKVKQSTHRLPRGDAEMVGLVPGSDGGGGRRQRRRRRHCGAPGEKAGKNPAAVFRRFLCRAVSSRDYPSDFSRISASSALAIQRPHKQARADGRAYSNTPTNPRVQDVANCEQDR